jgi:hypothetical protein
LYGWQPEKDNRLNKPFDKETLSSDNEISTQTRTSFGLVGGGWGLMAKNR